VLDPGSSSIDIYDMGSHLYQDFLPFRNPTSVIVSVDQGRIYVNENFGMFVLSASHQVLFSVPSGGPGRMAVAPGDRTAYVGEQSNDVVKVVDLVGRQTVDTIAVGDGPGAIAVSPDGRRVVVMNRQTVSVLDAAAGSEVARLNAGGVPGEVALTSDGKRAYFTFFDRAALGVVDLSRNEIVGEIALEGSEAAGLAFSPDGTRLYVANTTSLVEIDPKRNLILRSLAVGAQTSVVAISPDGRYAYVGALEANVFVPGLAVVDLPAWRVVGRIRGFILPVEVAFRRNGG
jgi:YVTN family beta-propeller protein